MNVSSSLKPAAAPKLSPFKANKPQTKPEKPLDTYQRLTEESDRWSTLRWAGTVALGTASSALAGTFLGALSGPAGRAAGAVMGGALGFLAGSAVGSMGTLGLGSADTQYKVMQYGAVAGCALGTLIGVANGAGFSPAGGAAAAGFTGFMASNLVSFYMDEKLDEANRKKAGL